MRYRPFAQTGIAVSSLSVALDGADDERTLADWRALVHGAFEEGVNAFEISNPSEALLLGFAEAVSAVRRSLLFISLRLGEQAPELGLEHWVEDVITATGVEELNLLNVHAERAADEAGAMRRLKQRGLVQHLGAVGSCEALETIVRRGGFGAIVTSFNLLSTWRERQLIRSALERQLGVIACNPWPPQLAPLIESARAAAKGGLFRRRQPLAGVGSYAFFASTPGWSPEQICIAYALTEPAVATVQVEVKGQAHLTQLAESTARALPSAVSAQIEMAKFSVDEGDGPDQADRRSA